MKKTILIFLAISLLFMFGCQNGSEKSDTADEKSMQVVEQNDRSNRANKEGMQPPERENGNRKFDIAVEDLDTTNFSQEQMDMLKAFENEEVTAYDLLNSGLFTREELGMGSMKDMLPPKEDLNVEGLSQEQLDIIEKLYSGEIVMDEILDSFTDEEIDSIGLGLVKNRPMQNQDGNQ